MIYFTSDLHFCHKLDAVYNPRGFNTVEEHDETIFNNWNNIVTDEDTVYVLGDLMLHDNEKGIDLIKRLKGNIIVILGNHDTTNRISLYETCDNIKKICYADMIKYKGKKFYLSHYPTIIHESLEIRANKEKIYSLYGHRHQSTNFHKDIPYAYHVGLDSHDNKVVSIDQIIKDCEAHYA